MSLVSEALRRARQEAADREGRGRGIPRAFVLPPRRWRSGPSLLLAIAIVLAAALGGAGIAWWALGRHAGATTQAQASTRTAPAMESTPGSSGLASAAAPSATGIPEVTAAAPSATLAPGPPALAASTAPAQFAPTPTVQPSAHEETAERQATAARPDEDARERSFVIDANLGYAKLHLDYIVYRPGSPFAKINGAEVMVGSVLDGFTVEEITDEFVKLRDKHGVVILRIH
jgi:hypothetical protein